MLGRLGHLGGLMPWQRFLARLYDSTGNAPGSAPAGQAAGRGVGLRMQPDQRVEGTRGNP